MSLKATDCLVRKLKNNYIVQEISMIELAKIVFQNSENCANISGQRLFRLFFLVYIFSCIPFSFSFSWLTIAFLIGRTYVPKYTMLMTISQNAYFA